METDRCAPALRFCPRCRAEKDLSDFHSKGDRKESVCKTCSNAKKKKKRDEKKRRERRKRAKNHTLVFSSYEVVGNLSLEVIENFGRAYGNLIQEVFNEDQ